MNSMRIARNKQNLGEVKFYPSNQHFPQQSLPKPRNPAIKSQNKRVRFDRQIPLKKQDTLENGKYYLSGPFESKQSMSEDYAPMSSSTNMFPSDIPVTDSKLLCSARAIVLTFIIVVLIIAAAGIAVGITIGMTKSSTSLFASRDENNSSNPNSGISISTMLTTQVTSSVSIGSQTGAPCSSYTTIDDPTRNINQTRSSGTCDRGTLFNATSTGSWIRFVGAGGTIIARTPPEKSNCGAYIPVWFNDTLPTAVGMVNNATLCLLLNLESCFIKMFISVVNCGSFYVYLLPSTPVCIARYCTE